MGEKGVGKLSRETPPPCEGEPMGALNRLKPQDEKIIKEEQAGFRAGKSTTE